LSIDGPRLDSQRPLSFPARVAAVDAGSNGVRCAVAQFHDERRFDILHSERIPVRLGHEVFLTGRLGAQTMEMAIEGIRGFRDRLNELGVGRFRACATSAVREAENSAEFLIRVRTQTGVELETINGAEEARLVYLAASNKIELGRRPWLLVDLGGGSLEVAVVDGQGIRWMESHAIGSVRLLEQLTQASEEPQRFLALLEEYASTIRMPLAEIEDLAGYIATGGNIEELARLTMTPPAPDGVSRLSMPELRRLIEMLAATPYRKRVEDLRLRPDRADVILPAAIVYERLGTLIDAKEILVPGAGVRDGILLDIVRQSNPVANDHSLDKQIEVAAVTLGRKFRFDEPHARHVADLALSIFDQTLELHRLSRDARRMLHAAALLHEIGGFISHSAHHKHSHYLIMNSPIVGLAPNELAVVANVARYHRKSPPKPSHAPFQALSKSDRQTVLELAAILRVADALDRDHGQHVKRVVVVVEKSRVRFLLDASGDLQLEKWSLKMRSDMFREVFGRRVFLEAPGLTASDLN
jgi:exopolyphosphatase/guanosine-5'-triphosphate,3'-diphosphate pyrophosphatase